MVVTVILISSDASNRTPLYLSAQEGHLEIVDYLLDSPSYQRPRVGLVDMPDSNGNTALHAACNRGHLNIVSTITGAYKSLSIDIYTVNDNGQTPLHLAAANGHVNTVMSLLSATTGTPAHQKLLTAVDDDGCSSLHLACQNGHYGMALYLSEVYAATVHCSVCVLTLFYCLLFYYNNCYPFSDLVKKTKEVLNQNIDNNYNWSVVFLL